MKLKFSKGRVVACVFCLVPLLAISGPTMARGGGCPVFTSEMVDAAFLAIDYSEENPPLGGAIDDPREPRIGCVLTNDAGNQFRVGVGDGEAGVEAFDTAVTDTTLRTKRFNLSPGESHACRAQILGSFVWREYCKPLLVD